MDFDRVKQGDVLTVSLSGRLEGVGAQELDNYIADTGNNCQFVSLVMDMTNVDYLSSAGLRMLLSLSKMITSEGGRFALANLQQFCMDVMQLTGFQHTFNIFKTLEEAQKYCGSIVQRQLTDGKKQPNRLETENGSFDFETISDNAPALTITGELEDILHSRINQKLIWGRKFQELNYSLGYGALGNLPNDFMPAIGPLLTVNGTMFWHNSDTGASDYMIPAGNTNSDILVQTGYDIALKGSFNQLIRFNASDTNGIPLKKIYSDLLKITAAHHKNFKGLLWCSMIAYASSVRGRNLTKAPLHENHPDNGKSIDHPSNIAEWYKTDKLPEHHDCVCLISGIAADLMHDLSDYSEILLDRVFYINPASIGGKEMLTQTHAAIFKDTAYNQKAEDFENECRKISNSAEFVRACELQDTTNIRHALIATAYIDTLETPAQYDAMFARTLDYKLNKNNLLLKTYHLEKSSHDEENI